MRARPPLALHVARGRAGRHADSHVGPRRRCCRRARRVGWLEEGAVILIRHVKGEPDRGLACDRRRGYPTHEGSCTPQPSSYPRSARAVSASAHTSAATATPISSGSPPRSRGRVALWCTTLYADYWATHYHFLSPLLPLLNPLWWQARCERQAFTSLALPAVAQVHDPRQPVNVYDESGRTAALDWTSRTGQHRIRDLPPWRSTVLILAKDLPGERLKHKPAVSRMLSRMSRSHSFPHSR